MRKRSLQSEKRIPVYREHEVCSKELQAPSNKTTTIRNIIIPKEQKEFHLRSLLRDNHTVQHIPVPKVDVIYQSNEHFSKRFDLPTNFIRYATSEKQDQVEYNLNEQDEEWLDKLNSQKFQKPLKDSDLELMLATLEQLNQNQEIKYKNIELFSHPRAQNVFKYWKECKRHRKGYLSPRLKMLNINSSSDPYVCFRPISYHIPETFEQNNTKVCKSRSRAVSKNKTKPMEHRKLNPIEELERLRHGVNQAKSALQELKGRYNIH
ncbi:hypothetical protein K7432_002756 [Basidiobolus ranarum]|uniref:Enhancer of polycomb-like protein n=1 Tax=Basidiobolus ranarum TaxID=34480 RepID=A0ABR2X133_9FUNG